MTRHARRSPQPMRRVAINNMALAANGARRLSAADVQRQIALVRQAVADLNSGIDSDVCWVSLADTANMTETMEAMGLARGHESQAVIEQAQQALGAIHIRHGEAGVWSVTEDELAALLWLAPMHEAQLSVCSYREFEAAFRRTARRMAQALAGNASPGAVVLAGNISAASATQEERTA